MPSNAAHDLNAVREGTGCRGSDTKNSFVGTICCHLRFDIPGRTRRVLLRNPLREICTVGSGAVRLADISSG